MILSMIMASTPSGIIGNNGSLPWPKNKDDLKRFRQLTMGKPCIMGRKTHQSLPKQLNGRSQIVISRSGYSHPDVETVTSMNEALKKAKEKLAKEAFIIGGAEIYKEGAKLANKLYITIMQSEYEGNIRVDLNEITEGFMEISSVQFEGYTNYILANPLAPNYSETIK